MFDRLKHLISKRRRKENLRYWQTQMGRAETMPLSELRSLRSQAKQLQSRLAQIKYVVGKRLTLPVIGSNAMRLPPRTLWSYRPALWRGPITPTGYAGAKTKTTISDEVTLFHDCTHSEITLRQIRNTRETDFAPFGMAMDVFTFDGSFMSLAIALPNEALDGLKQDHIIRVGMDVDSENPIEIFVRLNLKHGPNVEQIVREVDFNALETFVEFDLYEKSFNETRLDNMWVDLIFGSPSMNQVTLRDVTIIRRQRAAI